MTRLINADALFKYKFKSASERTDLSVEYMSGWNDSNEHISEKAPTVEAIPIEYMQSQVDCGKWQEIIQRWREHEQKKH